MTESANKSFEEVFNEEERATIEKCLENAQFDSIPSALESMGHFDFSPEKEKALEEYLKIKRPVSDDAESAVRNELQEKTIKDGFRIETPEEEKEWQARIDAEKKVKEESLRGVTVEAPPIVEIPPDDLSEVEMTKAEVMEELTKLNISFKPAQAKAELVDLLNASIKK